MNKALKNILERNSHRNLTDPIPSKDEMGQVYQAALRAPDHAWVRPSSFIQVSGEGLKKLSDIFVEVAEESFENLTDDILEKIISAKDHSSNLKSDLVRYTPIMVDVWDKRFRNLTFIVEDMYGVADSSRR